jgi:hypothetical protein
VRLHPLQEVGLRAQSTQVVSQHVI